MCEQGYLQRGLVKSDQVKSVGPRVGAHLEKQHNMNEERVIWVEETIIGVGPMERGFHLFKRRTRQPFFLMLMFIHLNCPLDNCAFFAT